MIYREKRTYCARVCGARVYQQRDRANVISYLLFITTRLLIRLIVFEQMTK